MTARRFKSSTQWAKAIAVGIITIVLLTAAHFFLDGVIYVVVFVAILVGMVVALYRLTEP